MIRQQLTGLTPSSRYEINVVPVIEDDSEEYPGMNVSKWFETEDYGEENLYIYIYKYIYEKFGKKNVTQTIVVPLDDEVQLT